MNRTLLFVTSFPPRECGIATFSQDLINAMEKSFAGKLNIEVCALREAEKPFPVLDQKVTYTLDPFDIDDCISFAKKVNNDNKIDLLCLEHEFGLWGGEYGHNLLGMLSLLDKPFIIRFHTVLPFPDPKRTRVVSLISALAAKVMVMTRASARLLEEVYHVPASKVVYIPHGTHAHIVDDVEALKNQYDVQGRMVLSTFGLLSENKGIETGIIAMREIANRYPEALYLILGKTHPVVASHQGEKYRERLEQLVQEYGLENNVRFVNSYLSLHTLLDYLSLTDIYLFTSKDPHQAVSGTFVYAMSAGCAIISTRFVQAVEMLDEGCGCLIDFNDHEQLAQSAIQLIGNPQLRAQMSTCAIEKTRSSIWENVAIAHMGIISSIFAEDKPLLPNLPAPYLDHVDRMTTEFGMLQFSKFDNPDPESGYTLDDNARALIACCMYMREIQPSNFIFSLCRKYVSFIAYCQRPSGKFLNYVDIDGTFSAMNEEVSLEDANGRAVWALGFALSNFRFLPFDLIQEINSIFRRCLKWLDSLEALRSMAFAIKGLYFYHQYRQGEHTESLVRTLAGKIQAAYDVEADADWKWYESSLTYGNAVLPEAMMMAWQMTGDIRFRKTAEESLAFLWSKTYNHNHMRLISNKLWYHRDSPQTEEGGEQPIEVAYTMLTLHTFYNITKDRSCLEKSRLAFSWFLGNNHLKQLVYNPLTFGCYDGLEKNNVNQNQGAESTVCYLMARLLMEEWNKYKYVTSKQDNSMEPARIGTN
ncbi:glycosyltransferase involved in cell wall biosynthesis [Chitinophaga dinghuensis]|uniref:Glycosyltransferase involved in cell wall biosynthesis n=1 Tax=Chitinophaga dinghuensis TaxID=1539050 RepID=A0A327W7U8_9BACT|nr:glycosyltransferase [Chitinophaga dinghuensis]RAJ85704.1 glycosyltransferase involved in cell wall biosynthesis [Chitinophaga dinghuensis]